MAFIRTHGSPLILTNFNTELLAEEILTIYGVVLPSFQSELLRPLIADFFDGPETDC